MPVTVAIHHKTSYSYDKLVELHPHQFRLRPAPHCRMPIKSYSFKISPSEHFINWQQDPFGNYVARVVFPEKAEELSFEVDIILDMVTINPFDFFVDDYAKHYPFKYEKMLEQELSSYFDLDEPCEVFDTWVKSIPNEKAEIVPFLFEVNKALSERIDYTVRLEAGVQTVEQTLSKNLGSCRDSAWVLVQTLRQLGIAARFVSGYLIQLSSDQKSLDGPSGPEADFTDLHAWAEAYIPGAGWIGLDATSGLFAGEGHIPLACTPHYSSAAPIIGATGKAEVSFDFSNSVMRIHEDPRVSKPYTENQWQKINTLGDRIEQQLIEDDVRLTMGGEPTFVSIDDYESAQWNSQADGPEKRALAETLFLKLQAHYAKGGLRHYGQGKWYPGEPLPRWQLACFWRKDGEAIWKDSELLADVNKHYEISTTELGDFAESLATELGIDSRFVLPAFEDAAYYLWAEGNLPAEFDPSKADLSEDLERKKLLSVLETGLNKACGFVLPIHWNSFSSSWQSSAWQMRREFLYLVPGDSSLGLRLPLERIFWQEEDAPLADQGRDPSEEVAPLGETLEQARLRLAAVKAARASHEISTADDPRVVTALCFEIRDAKLCVFMPPISLLEPYLLLLESIEAVAASLKMPVLIEGYAPPFDNRLIKLAVTPDPGVIEVNIHPTHSWDELKEVMFTLYKEARESRLNTVKYMVDGRQCGTGGGNHVTLGGASPLDSPLLRKPSVLQSFITYWQHHPGLSYLFSNTFIGPTSQAPRIDESRQEYLYELETAFSQFPDDETAATKPWLVDRLLRNLLVDITGNTHRSEFCIDKLYSPDSPTGRLGILEFRAFEMPPHPQMALTQMLLIRASMARFWRKPYRKPLVRWGTELHDKYLLPHYVWSDIKDIVNDFKDEGYDFDLAWFKPFWEFRFPVLGRVQIDNIQLELRAAIEPWHVLGEEMTSSGTARYVDSSVERLQIKLTGLTDNRYILSCNGVRAPLHPTGINGEFISGVRYRAWAPHSALHPTIGVQSPVVIDIVDTWTGKAIGGCTYHVTHPGGRSLDEFPVNGLEAEGRVLARFTPGGQSPGHLAPVFNENTTPNSGGVFTPTSESKIKEFDVPDTITEADFPAILDLLRHGK